MKVIKIGLIIFVVVVLSIIPSWFVYTRFCLDKYLMKDNTLSFENSTYICNEYWSPTDDVNLGKTIGIGVGERRTITDLIWPFWVMEYKDDTEHNSLYISGLMGSGGKYNKVSNSNNNK